MRENRLIHKIGGPPHAIRDTNKFLQTKEGETAAAAMASSMPREIIEEGLKFVRGNKPFPTEFKEAMAAVTYERLCDPRRCWTLKAIALTQGISEKLFYDWVKRYPLLQYAIESGKAVQESNFGSMLLHGFKYSSGVEFILTNLHNWTLKQKTEYSLDLNAAIAAQERAKRDQGIVWDEESVQKPAPLLVRQSPDENAAVREDDAEYKGANDE